MSKQKRTAGNEIPVHIVIQVERVLAAGARLRAALQAEGWIDQAVLGLGSPGGTAEWRAARAATGHAEVEYRKAVASATGGARVRDGGKDAARWSLVPIRKTS